ncbi:MAG TPA: TIGR03557 family F420-dependent LLM class oxidoreductase [Dehalococcoidia bacterium]|nr:TIGR03557 family F420-dependent LLM class oxidoreductase [Dehalococcoidia bacterium]
MTEYGYALSSEEHRPNDLVRYARMAEDAGFSFALISDHYHPWIDAQGQSAFVWATLGGIAQATQRLRVGTGVTCPLVRMHPAIVAQAAATVADMMPGRFFLGLGTGEKLNEHVTGEKWPSVTIRREMLAEAVDVIRELWRGEHTDHYGAWYTVEDARIYTLPDRPPPIYVGASGEASVELAAEIGDGLISTAPKEDLLRRFQEFGGDGKPRYGQVTVCWAREERHARETAHRYWPTAGLTGELTQELPLPRHFEQAVKMVTEDQVAGVIVCGPDPERYVRQIRSYEAAGFDHIYLHQVGPDQAGFFDFWQRELAPRLGAGAGRSAA